VSATPASFARVGLLLLGAVVVQLSGLGQLRLMGGHFDLVPLVVAAVALYAGSVPGAATGFAAGVLLDSLAGQTLGASSLVLCAVGYGVGRFCEQRDPSHGLMAIPIGAAAVAGWVVAFGAVSFMLDVGAASVSGLVFREMLVTVVLDTLIAVPVFALCRRVIRPALAVDPLEQRRRRRRPREAGPFGLRGMEV
jgi:rod shape-determining protein MreD